MLQSPDSRLRALGCPSHFIRRLHRYIILLYENDGVFQSKLEVAREMGERERREEEEREAKEKFWKRGKSGGKTVAGLMAETAPNGQLALARNLVDNL